MYNQLINSECKSKGKWSNKKNGRSPKKENSRGTGDRPKTTQIGWSGNP